MCARETLYFCSLGISTRWRSWIEWRSMISKDWIVSSERSLWAMLAASLMIRTRSSASTCERGSFRRSTLRLLSSCQWHEREDCVIRHCLVCEYRSIKHHMYKWKWLDRYQNKTFLIKCHLLLTHPSGKTKSTSFTILPQIV